MNDAAYTSVEDTKWLFQQSDYQIIFSLSIRIRKSRDLHTIKVIKIFLREILKISNFIVSVQLKLRVAYYWYLICFWN